MVRTYVQQRDEEEEDEAEEEATGSVDGDSSHQFSIERRHRCMMICDHTAMGAIILNTLVMAFQADYPEKTFWPTIDKVFLAFFTVEIVVRLSVYKRSFFTNQDRGWNITDLFLVLLGLTDQFIMPVLLKLWHNDSGPAHVAKLAMMTRVSRVLRVLRVLRAFRFLKNFKKLHWVTDGLTGSIKSVSWMFFFFFLLMFVYAILLTKLIGHANAKDPSLFEDPEQIDKWFGSIGRTMTTLFVWLTFDDWSQAARMVCQAEHMGWVYLIFVSYLFLGAFTFLSLITGLMADKMNEVRQTAEDEEKSTTTEELGRRLAQLAETFGEADLNQDKIVTLEEFRNILKDKELCRQLQECKCTFREDEVSELFKMLDKDGSQKLTWTEFSEGLLQISKEPTPKDYMCLEGSIIKIDRLLREVEAAEENWPRQLLSVRSRASLVNARLAILEQELSDMLDSLDRSALTPLHSQKSLL